MNITPHVLGVFFDIYGSNDQMNISKAILVSVVGFLTVVLILAIIALFIKLIAFIFSLLSKKEKSNVAITPSAAAPKSEMRSDVELIGVDEPTAAVIMALVSHNSGIDPDRLDFKSIKLLEDE